MKYGVEMSSGAMIYRPSFINTGSAIQKLIAGYTDMQRQWKLHKPTFIYFKISKVA
jgi:hypothetical protein